jgi:membrane fusion protein, multidrug efflux system
MEILKGKSRVRSQWIFWFATVGLAASVLLYLASEANENVSQERNWISGVPFGLPAAVAAQPVVVATAAEGDIPLVLSSLGTVNSLATVTVKSRFSGYLTDIYFREGQMVKKGDLLAQVDPRPYEAALAQYQRLLEKDQALLDNARLDLDHYQRLTQQDATSVQAVDTAAAMVRQYERAVGSDQAQVDTQKLNLDYCRITSPVEGRVGLRQVDAGNYVTASDANGIVLVTQMDPISVIFPVLEHNLPQIIKRSQADAKLKVTIYNRSGAEKRGEGVLDGIDNQVDVNTGAVKLRALFQNADGSLFPNELVNVVLLLDTLQNVVTVPSTAVQRGTPGTFVYRVNADNKTVSVRKVSLGPSAGDRVAVLSGLAAGDVVVINGADHLWNGTGIAITGAEASKP